MRPSREEWIAAFLAGLKREAYSGRVELTIDFNKGGITRVVPMKQEPAE